MKQHKNKNMFRKVAVVGLIMLSIAVFRYFDLGQYLSLEYITAGAHPCERIDKSRSMFCKQV